MNETEKDMTCFEVETFYKSGRHRSDVITAESEEKMWEIYNKHFNASLIENTILNDAWPA